MVERDDSGGPQGGRSFDLLGDELSPIRRYKLLLHAFLKRRRKGVRQAIAERIGTNRSFVSQMTSPAYDVPVPCRHVPIIARTAGFTAAEQRVFMDAYVDAHPESAAVLMRELPETDDPETLAVRVPKLDDPSKRQRLRSLLETVAAEFVAALPERVSRAQRAPGMRDARPPGHDP